MTALTGQPPQRSNLCHNLIMNPVRVSDRIFLGPQDTNLTGQWPPQWRWPADYRRIACNIFTITPVLCLANILYIIHQHYAFSLLRNVLTGPIFSVHMAAISGMAAWTVWKNKTWARGWAIAASLLFILMFLRQFIIPMRPAWDHHVAAL